MVAASALTAWSATPASAAWEVLNNWTNVVQLKSNWCWAASDYSILAHYGYWGQTQADLVNYVYGTTNAPNNPGTLSQAQSALNRYGVSTNSFLGTLSFSDVQAQISGNGTTSGNKPIWSGWTLTLGGAHAVVIIGWSTESATKQLRYMDPYDGNAYWTGYDFFVSDSEHKWVNGLKDARAIR